MEYFIESLLISLMISSMIIKLSAFHISYTKDPYSREARRAHTTEVPRIGGISVFLGIFLTLFHSLNFNNYKLLLISATPIFLIGIVEDIIKNLGVKTRLIILMIGSIISIFILDIFVINTKINFIDNIIASYSAIAVIITLFCILGLINSYNIIDGMNGLSSSQAILSTATITFIALLNNQTGEEYIIGLCLIGSVSGFLVLNFPSGKIFLGDGGAYLIGFFVAYISIKYTYKSSEISPWTVILINSYPITETLFSAVRRISNRKTSAISADALHLHSLLFRRILFNRYQNSKHKTLDANWRTTTYILIYSLIPAIISIFFYNSTKIVVLFYIFYVSSYIFIYFYLLNNKKNKWLT